MSDFGQQLRECCDSATPRIRQAELAKAANRDKGTICRMVHKEKLTRDKVPLPDERDLNIWISLMRNRKVPVPEDKITSLRQSWQQAINERTGYSATKRQRASATLFDGVANTLERLSE